MTNRLTNPQVFEIFRKIAAGERRHGSFLTAFAQAYVKADQGNRAVLQEAALKFVEKYSLRSYAIGAEADAAL